MAGKRSPVLPVNTLLITGRGQFHGPISELDTSRDGAIILSDLIGKLDVLRVTCEKCGRDGRAYLTIPRAAAGRTPTRIVKLIRHAKSTDAAHGFSLHCSMVEKPQLVPPPAVPESWAHHRVLSQGRAPAGVCDSAAGTMTSAIVP
jgi:hypothetical protein